MYLRNQFISKGLYNQETQRKISKSLHFLLFCCITSSEVLPQMISDIPFCELLVPERQDSSQCKRTAAEAEAVVINAETVLFGTLHHMKYSDKDKPKYIVHFFATRYKSGVNQSQCSKYFESRRKSICCD